MTRKNRAIRVEDELWEQCKTAAMLAGKPLSDWVREILKEESKPLMCFHCGQPAIEISVATLTKEDDYTYDQRFAHYAKTGYPPEAQYTPVKITVPTCALHTEAVADLLLDGAGVVVPRTVRKPKEGCEHPWHSSQDAEVMTHYRCPACGKCGVSNTRREAVHPGHESFPAYEHIRDAVEHFVSEIKRVNP